MVIPLCLSLAVAGCLLACGERPSALDDSEEALELIEVDGGPTSTLVPDEDEIAPQTGPRLSGELPGDFPRGLPIYLPASIVDLGEVGGDSNYVVLDTPDSVRNVHRALGSSINQSSWTRLPGDNQPPGDQAPDNAAFRVTDGETIASYIVERGERGGTLIRISYR